MISTNNLLRSQLVSSRAHLLLSAAVAASATGAVLPTPCGCAFSLDMSRRLLHGSLHLDLLVTVIGEVQ